MPDQLDLYDLRRREVQALGAALSCRNWHMMETAYNSLRDKMDNAGFTAAGPRSTTPSQGLDAATVERVVDQLCAGRDGTQPNLMSAYRQGVRDLARALATDPHQHGAGNVQLKEQA